MTVAQWLANASTRGIARIDARAILCHVLNVNAAWLIAHSQDEIPTAQKEASFSFLEKRKVGEPLAYLLGKKEFFGRDFFVDKNVLVPRPETELLVEIALSLFDANAEIHILDLGTGSGCIGLTIAAERARWRVSCADVSDAALNVAKKNACALGVESNVAFIASNWFSNIAKTQGFDLIVSNPPYIAKDDAHLHGDGLRFEPKIALTDHEDGFAPYRIFAAAAHLFLNENGWLLMEHGATQASAIGELFDTSSAWKNRRVENDLAQLPRVTTVQRA